VLGDPSGLYLGWFGVKKSARGQGVGEQLLVHAIAEAMRSGVPYLRLETSDEPYLAAANRLYENHGLVVFRRDQESLQATWPTVWRELSLTSKAFP
jgi:ribosomal protein S18 acetylase RimI-like enzyme